jgi:hypothetical protein
VTLWDLLRPLAKALGMGPTKATPKRRPGRRKAGPEAKPTARRGRPGPSPADSEPTLFARPAGGRVATRTTRTATSKARVGGRMTMQERYDQVVREMLAKYDIKVRRWRKSMSGIATLLTYRDGTQRRFLESPKPKTPLSMSIFLHEVGHHAIGLGVHKPRCLEEFLAWKFSLDTMRELGLPVTEKVETRMRRSMEYAVGKATRRGIRELPPEVAAYAKRLPPE